MQLTMSEDNSKRTKNKWKMEEDQSVGTLIITYSYLAILWFVLTRSWVWSQPINVILKVSKLIGPLAILLEHWAFAPNRSTSLDPQLQNRNIHAPLNLTFSVYILRSWTYGIKPRCYWEHLGECIKEQFWNLGILWELDGNTVGTRRKKQKKKLPQPQPQKTDPIMSACWAFPFAAWKFYIQNCLSPFFGLG